MKIDLNKERKIPSYLFFIPLLSIPSLLFSRVITQLKNNYHIHCERGQT